MGAALATIKLMNQEEKQPASNLSQPSVPDDHPERAENQATAEQPAATTAHQRAQPATGEPAAAAQPTHSHTLIYDDLVNRVWCSSCLKSRPRATE
eukprot:6149477-Amphidinium_carterae.1